MQHRGTADLVGVGDAGLDERDDRVAVRLDEILERRERVFAGLRVAAEIGIEALERMLRAAQQKIMRRAEQQIGMRLAGLGARGERPQALVVRDALRNPGIELRARLARVGGEEPPIIEGLVGHLFTVRSPRWTSLSRRAVPRKDRF
jgi:hypothetical protein